MSAQGNLYLVTKLGSTLETGEIPATLDAKTLTALKRTVDDITVLVFAANTDIDFNDNEVKTLSLTGNITFTTSNRAAGKNKTILITNDATLRTFTFPAWVFVGSAAPANIAVSKRAVLTLTCTDGTDAGIRAAYAVES